MEWHGMDCSCRQEDGKEVRQRSASVAGGGTATNDVTYLAINFYCNARSSSPGSVAKSNITEGRKEGGRRVSR